MPALISPLVDTEDHHLNLRDVRNRRGQTHGAIIHTTGRGVVEAAEKHGADPFEYTLAYYAKAEYFAHYVIGWQGEYGCVAPESECAPHAGIGPEEREKYKNGDWKYELPRDVVRMWFARWGMSIKTPLDVIPGPYGVNDYFCGWELIPLKTLANISPPPGLELESALSLYTWEQYDKLAMALVDFWCRWKLPPNQIQLLPSLRCFGHEDINPLKRTTVTPPAGWDPGGLRSGVSWFHWSWLNNRINYYRAVETRDMMFRALGMKTPTL